MMPGENGQRAERSWPAIGAHIYRVCTFPPGAVVPRVQLIGADGDEEAIALASIIDPWSQRELWDRHRLVAHLPAAQQPATELPAMELTVLA